MLGMWQEQGACLNEAKTSEMYTLRRTKESLIFALLSAEALLAGFFAGRFIGLKQCRKRKRFSVYSAQADMAQLTCTPFCPLDPPE